jgi:hypothetical protein
VYSYLLHHPLIRQHSAWLIDVGFHLSILYVILIGSKQWHESCLDPIKIHESCLDPLLLSSLLRFNYWFSVLFLLFVFLSCHLISRNFIILFWEKNFGMHMQKRRIWTLSLRQSISRAPSTLVVDHSDHLLPSSIFMIIYLFGRLFSWLSASLTIYLPSRISFGCWHL